MSIFHIHYELLPVEHPYNRCDIRQLHSPLDQETYMMQLLPHTLWGTLYIEVNGQMLFQRHWRYRQKAPFDSLPLSGFTCELLEFAQVLGSNLEDILSGQRGPRPVEFIGYDVQLWFRRHGSTVQLSFDERPVFTQVFTWQLIPLAVFVAETTGFLSALWQDVIELNPALATDTLIQEQITAAERIRERFAQGEFSQDVFVEDVLPAAARTSRRP
jgi:hypothetical protein